MPALLKLEERRENSMLSSRRSARPGLLHTSGFSSQEARVKYQTVTSVQVAATERWKETEMWPARVR